MERKIEQQIEKYLKQATRGLPTPLRKSVQGELRADIEQRMLDHLIAGFSREEALQQALVALGRPEIISKGMQMVHVSPQLTRWGAVTLLAGALLLAAHTTAQGVQVVTEGLLPNCTSTRQPSAGYFCYSNWREKTWVSLDALKKQLQDQGAQLREETATYQMAVQGEDHPTLVHRKQLRIILKEGNTLLLDPEPQTLLGSAAPSGGWTDMTSGFLRNNLSYVDTSEMLRWIERTGKGVSITLRDPLGRASLHFSDLTLQFQTDQKVTSVKDYFLDLGERTLNGSWDLPYQVYPNLHYNEPEFLKDMQARQAFSQFPINYRSIQTHPQTVRVNAPVGTAYWIVHLAQVNNQACWVLDAARVNANHTLTFRSVYAKPEYVKSLHEWGSEDRPTVALLKFGGQINADVPYRVDQPIK